MSAPPPKRARQDGSFSPASPPYYEGAKPPPQPTTYSPQTPFSPPSMTSSAPQNASDKTMNASNLKVEQPADTPPSGFTGIPGLTLTSNSISNESNAHVTEEAPKEAEIKSAPRETSATVDNADNRRSDHERKETEPAEKEEYEWEKGWRTKEFGPYYLVDTEPIKRPKISPHNDLIEQFGLTNIANSVRRFDPFSGEKINKLRKSYEGKVKQLGIAGRNKAVSVPGEFFPSITSVPEQEWKTQHRSIDDLEKAMTGAEFEKKLEAAFAIGPAPLDKETDSKFKSLLSNDDGPKKGPAEISRKPSGLQPGAPVGSQRPSAISSPSLKPSRPERAGAKRRYNDTSFAGYTDTFDTEELDSEGDAQGGRMKKKQRKTPCSVPARHVTANPAFSQDEGHPWLFNDGGHEMAEAMLQNLRDGEVALEKADSPAAVSEESEYDEWHFDF